MWCTFNLTCLVNSTCGNGGQVVDMVGMVVVDMMNNIVNMVDMLDNVDLVNKLWTWWASGGLWAGRQETAAGQAALPTGSQARESHVLHGFNDPASSSETKSGWPGLVWSSRHTPPPVLPSSPGAGAGLCLPRDHLPGLLEITFEMTMTTDK